MIHFTIWLYHTTYLSSIAGFLVDVSTSLYKLSYNVSQRLLILAGTATRLMQRRTVVFVLVVDITFMFDQEADSFWVAPVGGIDQGRPAILERMKNKYVLSW